MDRSANMRAIRSKGTNPEMFVRRLVHGLGYRYRLHVPDLPGKPDLVFPKMRKVIFVHGCFWHLHKGCRDGHIPKSRRDYWEPKLRRNAERDASHLKSLRKLGWKPLIIWECALKQSKRTEKRLIQFLNG
jgi:DNA mismatch endonuclease (patch repair protein)